MNSLSCKYKKIRFHSLIMFMLIVFVSLLSSYLVLMNHRMILIDICGISSRVLRRAPKVLYFVLHRQPL